VAQLVAHSLWERGVASSSLAAPTKSPFLTLPKLTKKIVVMIDLRYVRSGDWISFFLVVLLSGIGLLTVLSATYRPEEPLSFFFKKQLFGVLTGLIIYVVASYIDYRTFERWGYFLYFAIIGLLVFTIFKGSVGFLGGQRWINVGLFRFQPSECAKLFFAPFLSYFLVTDKGTVYTPGTFAPVILTLVVSTLLVLKQPDLGTAVILLCSGLLVIWLAGMHKQFFLICGLVGLVLAPLAWKVLRPYQQQRIAVFLGAGDAQKERYQLEQSKIAIGSGGLWGKGFLKGTQNKLHFLPEGRTDCIFSVFCEEWGFRGALFLLFLYGILFYRLLSLIAEIKQFYAQVLVVGCVMPLALATVINMGMVTGLLPIVGIPLPFMTYGISHLWISYASLGCVQSVMMRRFLMVR
jgi:rod shape determining protein RodA